MNRSLSATVWAIATVVAVIGSLSTPLNAQTQEAPACAVSCATQVASLVGCSTISNTTCICGSPPFATNVGECIGATCQKSDLDSAENYLNALCSDVLPPSASSTDTGATHASSSSHVSSSAPQSAAPTTAASSHALASASISSTNSSPSSHASSLPSSAPASSSASTSSSAAVSPSPSPSPSSNAALRTDISQKAAITLTYLALVLGTANLFI
ncbi:hypothetical protein DENSPDRAFT_844046 [Dentipellis sp. KUC8613]|nr:hypothetical protein DENSPDRAFT_844046 [Dentipellis sp. KUC8613]